MNFFVYILRTNENTLYTGQTNNLKRRLEEHKKKTTKSAKYMRRFIDFELVYSEKFKTRKEAMAKEAEIKNWRKTRKEKLIEEMTLR
jgi:putative endonuclease